MMTAAPTKRLTTETVAALAEIVQAFEGNSGGKKAKDANLASFVEQSAAGQQEDDCPPGGILGLPS
jgi:hypothetical protein